MKGYSKRQIHNAKRAKKLLAAIGYPSVKDFKAALKSGMIKNCPVNVEDLDICMDIFGNDIASLKGKTTRNAPDRVRTNIIAVPRFILHKNGTVTLDIDLFYVNRLGFLTSLSQNITFGTVQHVLDRKATTILNGVMAIIEHYLLRGFTVKVINADNEFEPLRKDLIKMGIATNITSANEHVPRIERRIRLIKERVRSIRHTLPYVTMPKSMVVDMVKFVVHWLNAFPVKGGISENMSPGLIMTGKSVDFQLHCKQPFGSYVQTHEENSPRNSQQARTLGAITLGLNNSSQAGYYFMNLNTGKRIHRRSWTPVPMPDEVIKRIEQLGKKDNQPNLLVFTDNG